MIAKSFFYAAAGAAALVSANAASAAVLVDGYPATDARYDSSRNGEAANQSDRLNPLVQVTFAQDVELTSFSILSRRQAFGPRVIFKLREDIAGTPSATNLLFRTGGATRQDVRFVNFGFFQYTLTFDAPIAVEAGTYWLGMSGLGGLDLQWSYFNSPTTPERAQYNLVGERIASPGIVAGPITGRGNLGFQVNGNILAAAVPEPTTWAMMIGGFGLVGGAMRRRAAKLALA